MFTGIIETTGKVEKTTKNSIVIKASSLMKELKTGSSISVDGVCLTVRKKNTDVFEADVMPITLERSTLGERKKGDLVNLELAMLASERFEGHIVTGHTEGMATLTGMRIADNAYHLTFQVPTPLTRYIVTSGSVALNGISLTIIDTQDDQLEVGIIPHTWDNTNLHTLKVGDKVNVETDILAKYAEKLGL